MRVLAPYVLSDNAVDEWQIWLNTKDADDLAWLEKLGAHSKVRLIEPPLDSPDGIRTINQFWRFCDDTSAIYIRLDDDIVWLEKDFFANLIQLRQSDETPLFVSAMVINNAICTYILQLAGVIKLDTYLPAQCMNPISWESGEFAEQLHAWAIKGIPLGILPIRLGNYPIAMNRFSINAICFYGKDIQPYIAKLESDEEEFFSCMLPTYLHRMNVITANAWCCHYSFGPQHRHLSGTGILDQYKQIMLDRFAGADILKSMPPM
jgi:hypothetical protein